MGVKEMGSSVNTNTVVFGFFSCIQLVLLWCCCVYFVCVCVFSYLGCFSYVQLVSIVVDVSLFALVVLVVYS
jgi:hypothetical protein